MSRLVIGLGSARWADDGVGPAVAAEVDRMRLPDVHVVVEPDALGLIPRWDHADVVVVVDAVATGGVPGALTVHEVVGDGAAGTSTGAWASTWSRPAGPQPCGLAAAVELARALHRLPRRLALVGIEAGSFDDGSAMSPPVSAAVPRAAAVAAALVSLGLDRAPVGAAPAVVG
ncbi:hydrogenase maturation protease [Cellulomonas carbonis]|uniref:Hydrogenase maturation protease n=1 Tax=Cellulomonas carbonis T26 TaxID=947969 RepID=A0A0A0BMT0_9CELL|nr:hydrogenase maturation protease [Cellulomonas carbonis]KGM09022.1 hydrogenase maturation protease [Cellulomonas carbonis T26]GGC17404.1 hypothetical protein GCM10010972_33340 [Cellulomonas carbonis]